MVSVRNKGGKRKIKKNCENTSFRNTGDPHQPKWESPREASKDRPQLHFASVFTKKDDRQC